MSPWYRITKVHEPFEMGIWKSLGRFHKRQKMVYYTLHIHKPLKGLLLYSFFTVYENKIMVSFIAFSFCILLIKNIKGEKMIMKHCYRHTHNMPSHILSYRYLVFSIHILCFFFVCLSFSLLFLLLIRVGDRIQKSRIKGDLSYLVPWPHLFHIYNRRRRTFFF
jgi:hypothetical protein